MSNYYKLFDNTIYNIRNEKMDLLKYKNSGIGLSKHCFMNILNILNKIQTNNINILEFGSGISTEFFKDYKLIYNKNIYIDSFDNDINYSYKNIEKHKFINMNILPLVSCSDKHFNIMMNENIYNSDYMNIHTLQPTWRQRNCFYNITNELDEKKYDLVLLDGPNGNGRNISYLHFKNKLKKNAYIVIDDYNSHDNEFDYNFIGYLKNLFNIKEIYTHTYKSQNEDDEWDNGGNFAIYQLIE